MPHDATPFALPRRRPRGANGPKIDVTFPRSEPDLGAGKPAPAAARPAPARSAGHGGAPRAGLRLTDDAPAPAPPQPRDLKPLDSDRATVCIRFAGTVTDAGGAPIKVVAPGWNALIDAMGDIAKRTIALDRDGRCELGALCDIASLGREIAAAAAHLAILGLAVHEPDRLAPEVLIREALQRKPDLHPECLDDEVRSGDPLPASWAGGATHLRQANAITALNA